MRLLAGVDIGGTKCAVVIGEERGEEVSILGRRAFATAEHPAPERALERARAELAGLLGGRAPAAIGISCGGPLDSKRGLILSPPNLPGWDEVDARGFFERAFGVPASLQNDANACALAEWRYGAGRGSQNFVFFTFGTGLGAGIILSGRLVEGACGMAGEVGHWRVREHGPVGYGKAGSLEGFCSGGGIAQLAASRAAALPEGSPLAALGRPPSARDVFALAASGDAACREIVEQVGEDFGHALAMIVDLLNPEIIVAGSIFTRNYDVLHPIVRRAMEREALPFSAARCRILPAVLGDEIGDVAALATATLALPSEQ